jgi:hypothetical protein
MTAASTLEGISAPGERPASGGTFGPRGIWGGVRFQRGNALPAHAPFELKPVDGVRSNGRLAIKLTLPPGVAKGAFREVLHLKYKDQGGSAWIERPGHDGPDLDEDWEKDLQP